MCVCVCVCVCVRHRHPPPPAVVSEKTDIALNNRITSEVLIFELILHQIKGSYFKHNLQNCTHGVMKVKVFLYVFKNLL